MLREIVTMEGHLIDSDILRRAFARIVEEGGEFEVLEFRVGKTNDEPSFARLAVGAPEPGVLDRIVEGLNYLGASSVVEDARFAPAEAGGILPDEFHSTSNFETFVRIAGAWQPVQDQKMDCVIVLRDGAPRCVKQRRVLGGEPAQPFVPQPRYLSILGTGDGHAVATRGAWAIEGRWVWWWKDYIDRKWMRMYR